MKATSWLSGNALRFSMIAAALSLTACDAVNEAVDEIRDIGRVTFTGEAMAMIVAIGASHRIQGALL